MADYLLTVSTWLPLPAAAVFPFFADATNLEVLTPPWLRFDIRTPSPIQMHLGARIEYRIRLHGVPVRWLTEISAWDPPYAFVDRQLRGPYREWRHTHRFVPCDGGTSVEDEVRYRVPGGALVHGLLVGRDLRKVFGYRQDALVRHFDAEHTARRSALVISRSREAAERRP